MKDELEIPRPLVDLLEDARQHNGNDETWNKVLPAIGRALLDAYTIGCRSAGSKATAREVAKAGLIEQVRKLGDEVKKFYTQYGD